MAAMTRLEFYQELGRRLVAQGLQPEDFEMTRTEDPASMRHWMIFMVRGREFVRASYIRYLGSHCDEVEDVEWAKALGEPNLRFKGINKWRNLYEEAPSQGQV
jgi:hypothetical protein